MKKGFAIWMFVVIAVAVGYYINEIKNKPVPAEPAPIVQENVSEVARENVSQAGTPSKPVVRDDKEFVPVRQIDVSYKGLTKVTKGYVYGLRETKQHTVHFMLKDPDTGHSIKGILFKKTNLADDSFKALLEESATDGKVVFIKGEIDVYEGELEIKAWQVYLP